MSLVYRLDASDIATMWADTGKTTQITDGTGVATWSPKAGAVTTDAVQATSLNRPTYRSSYSSTGYPAVEFDGSNDFMTIAHSSGWDNTTAYEIVAVVHLPVAAGSGVFRVILQKTNTTGWTNGLHFVHFQGLISGGSPAYNQNTMSEIIGERLLVYLRSSTTAGGQGNIGRTSWPFTWTRTNLTGNTTPTTNTEAVRLGSGYTSGFHFSGAIHELRVYSGGETSGDIAAVWADMANRWGILTTGGGGFRPVNIRGGADQ
jgi:hypothetical protein